MENTVAAITRGCCIGRRVVCVGLFIANVFPQSDSGSVCTRYIIGRENVRRIRDDRNAEIYENRTVIGYGYRRVCGLTAVDGNRADLFAQAEKYVNAARRRHNDRLHMFGGYGFLHNIREGIGYREPDALVDGQLFRYELDESQNRGDYRIHHIRGNVFLFQTDRRVSARRRLRAKYGNQHKIVPRDTYTAVKFIIGVRDRVRGTDIVRRHRRAAYHQAVAKDDQTAPRDTGDVFMRRGILYVLRSYRADGVRAC